MPREARKCREWEKERRERLNNSFLALSKVLPNYDPSLTLSKIEILQRAAAYIEQLLKRNTDLISDDKGINKSDKEELKKLCERVKKLLVRNEQLANLLNDAGIKIPSECGLVKNFKGPLPWSNKITPEQATVIKKRLLQKENESPKVKKISKKQLKSTKSPPINSATISIKRRKVVTKKSNLLSTKKSVKVKKKLKPLGNVVTMKGSVTLLPSSMQNLNPLSNPQPCYVIANAALTSLNNKSATVVTQTRSLTTPIVATSVHPGSSTTQTHAPLSALGPGTLILANGNIMPVLPASSAIFKPTQSILTRNTPILVNSTQTTNTTLIVMKPNTFPSTKDTDKKHTKGLPVLKPKLGLTKTTTVNKVPIPALGSRINLATVKTKTKDATDDKKVVRNVKKVVKKKTVVVEPIAVPPVAAVVKEGVNVTSDKASTEEPDAKRPKTDVAALKETAVETSNYSIDSLCKDSEKVVEKELDVAPAPEPIAHKVVAVPEITEVVAKSSPEVTTASSVVAPSCVETLSLQLPHSELSNDIFASLQVPTGSQNPESTSPTAAFLMAFPLVTTLTGVKESEVLDEDNSDSQQDTPTLLQIGTMETNTKPTQSESLTPNLLNLDNFSFFSAKDMNGYYPGASYDVPKPEPVPKCPKSTATTNHLSTSHKTTNSNLNINSYPVSAKATDIVGPVHNFPVVSSHYQQKNVSYQLPHVSSSVAALNPNKPVQSTMEMNLPHKSSSFQVHDKHSDHGLAYAKKTKQQSDNRCSYTCSTTTAAAPVAAAAPSTYSFSSSQCNTYNPFTDFTASFGTFTPSKTCSEPLYTNSSSNYNYGYQPDGGGGGFAAQNSYASVQSKKFAESATSYTSVGSYKYPGDVKGSKQDYVQAKTTTDANLVRPPVNWMTTPDLRHSAPNSDYLVPSFGKDLVDFGQNPMFPPAPNSQSYYNANSSVYSTPDLQTFTPVLPPNSFQQRNDVLQPEDNQYSWSPTKLPSLLDSQHNILVPATLPTLMGDLALGMVSDKKIEEQSRGVPKETSSCRNKDNKKMKQQAVAYETQTQNFLSVSQLVDHGGKTQGRRNSGARASTKPTPSRQKVRPSKIADAKEQHWTPVVHDVTKTNKNYKSSSSSYSAESLIGAPHAVNTNKQSFNHFHYPQSTKSLPMPSFIPDNIFLPAVDFPSTQDNFSHQQNQTNYQTNSFTPAVQNTAYSNSSYISSAPTITSSYLPSAGLLPDIGNEFINAPMQDNLFSHNNASAVTANHKVVADKSSKTSSSSGNMSSRSCSLSKKPLVNKRKHSNDTSGISGFADLGFLSISGSINSPILPDDYHSHANFLPPPPPPPAPSQFFPCKNSLYPKQTPDLLAPPPRHHHHHATVQHPETSPMGGNVGPSLTNFNLSTIFPEINKGPTTSGLYSSSARVKDYQLAKNDHLLGHSISQGPFNNKPLPARALPYNSNGISSSIPPFPHT